MGVPASGLTDTSQLDKNDPWTTWCQFVTFLYSIPPPTGPSSWKLLFFLLHLFGCTGSQLQHTGYLLSGRTFSCGICEPSPLPKARTCAPAWGACSLNHKEYQGSPGPIFLLAASESTSGLSQEPPAPLPLHSPSPHCPNHLSIPWTQAASPSPDQVTSISS